MVSIASKKFTHIAERVKDNLTAQVYSSSRGTSACVNNMNLFGIPYQFIESVDPRIPSVSNTIGANFVENVILSAPTCYFIPGKAVFLPGVEGEQKDSLAKTMLEFANGEGSLAKLLDGASDDSGSTLRYYDFEESYGEYMKYVNIMCRTVASFLNLKDTFKCGSKTVSLQQYDWKNYRWNTTHYANQTGAEINYIVSTAVKNLRNMGSAVMNGIVGRGDRTVELDTGDADPGWTSNNYLQFYIDPSSGSNRTLGNQTSESNLKAAIDGMSSKMREFKFMADSAGVGLEGVEGVFDTGMDALSEALGGSKSGGMGSVMSQILSVGSHVLKGENIILPEIYQNSEYSVDYTIDIHLKAMYGNKYSVYTDVIVPLLHLMALVLPRQSTSNTYGSPFLVKCYYPGVFNCNLGMVERLQTTVTGDTEYSVDGLPLEIDCQLGIKDLYSDLSMSPSTEPSLFRNNTSLIDYLSTIAGINLIEPQMDNKFKMFTNVTSSSIYDIGGNIKSGITDYIEKKLSGFVNL